ncbi:PilZ domain-containing protein [Bradyrhizobium sp.]|uniref:PilZ domain-containing protein n=1 Tax=Bradyrhizobium sp. TaxID=376 RepID=UPI0025BA93A0|nr:PilZ domain-containing protein [Bradyrhizobium sp.]
MPLEDAKTKVQREPRRELRKRPTWMTVDDGVTKIECFVLDVSPGGAKIATDAAIDVRDRFLLALVPEHPKRQGCEVVWRRGKTYGIKFLAEHDGLAQAPASPAAEKPIIVGGDFQT